MALHGIPITLCSAALGGLLLVPATARAQFGDPVAEADDRFGEVVARGDFNGDGYQDLAVGMPWEDLDGQSLVAEAGAVEVIYGGANGLDPANRQFWSQDSAGVEDVAEEADFFGDSLAAGDFNNDGFDDLAVGAPLEDVGGVLNAGSVNVLYGSALGLSVTFIGDQLWHQDIAAVQDSVEAEDEFGWSVAAGDFNGDGRDDLAVGVAEDVGAISNAGAVNVIYGSSAGLSATTIPDQLWHQNSSGVNDAAETDDLFGHSLAAADFNGDGRDDLAVGVSEDLGSIVDAGAVNVLYGSPAGLNATAVPDQLWHQNVANVEDVAEAGDAFGPVTAGDFNGDGRDDLAIGARGEDADAGAVNVIYGSSAGLDATSIPDQFWHQDVTDVQDLAEAGDRFGMRSAAGDFNGDGIVDLAIAVRLEDVGPVVDAGAVSVLYGTSAGLSAVTPIVDQLWHQDAAGVEDAAQAGDVFGWSLSAGDFNGDGADDLAAGTPGEDMGVVRDAGAINVIHGSTRGLDAQIVPDQLWHQILVP